MVLIKKCTAILDYSYCRPDYRIFIRFVDLLALLSWSHDTGQYRTFVEDNMHIPCIFPHWLPHISYLQWCDTIFLRRRLAPNLLRASSKLMLCGVVPLHSISFRPTTCTFGGASNFLDVLYINCVDVELENIGQDPL